MAARFRNGTLRTRSCRPRARCMTCTALRRNRNGRRSVRGRSSLRNSPSGRSSRRRCTSRSRNAGHRRTPGPGHTGIRRRCRSDPRGVGHSWCKRLHSRHRWRAKANDIDSRCSTRSGRTANRKRSAHPGSAGLLRTALDRRSRWSRRRGASERTPSGASRRCECRYMDSVARGAHGRVGAGSA